MVIETAAIELILMKKMKYLLVDMAMMRMNITMKKKVVGVAEVTTTRKTRKQSSISSSNKAALNRAPQVMLLAAVMPADKN
jgi:hypothetical protein